MTKIKTSYGGVLLLLLTSIIWGTSFVAQGEGGKALEPFSFNAIRSLIGALVLLPVILIRDKISASSMTQQQLAERKKTDRKTLIYGSLVGLAFCIATNFQQYAFTDTGMSDGKVAFITAMYMFMVPLAGLFFKKRVSVITWICVLASIAGLYLLCITEEGFGSMTYGVGLTIICAVFFTVQILLIEKFAPDCDGVKLSCIEFFVSGIITTVLMFIFEHPHWDGVITGADGVEKLTGFRHAIIPVLYTGIMSCGVAYTFQILGQKKCEATLASLLMSLESVFAVLAESLCLVLFGIGNKHLSDREIIGCVIMFAAILISQLSEMFRNKE